MPSTALKNDTRIFLQIHHAGGRVSSKISGLQPVAPSAVPAYPGAEMPRALTREEIAGLVEAHVEAAGRAKAAGFDGVDIHCAHGYLVPSFFSPLTNLRTDEYGGDLTGRTRFLTEIVRGIRARLGKDFPLTIKISGDEYIEGGLGIPAMIEIARLAEEAGIDGLIVSAGTPGGQKFEDLAEAHKVMRTLPMMTEPGCLVPIAAEFKKALRIPVVTVGPDQHDRLGRGDPLAGQGGHRGDRPGAPGRPRPPEQGPGGTRGGHPALHRLQRGVLQADPRTARHLLFGKPEPGEGGRACGPEGPPGEADRRRRRRTRGDRGGLLRPRARPRRNPDR